MVYEKNEVPYSALAVDCLNGAVITAISHHLLNLEDYTIDQESAMLGMLDERPCTDEAEERLRYDIALSWEAIVPRPAHITALGIILRTARHEMMEEKSRLRANAVIRLAQTA